VPANANRSGLTVSIGAGGPVYLLLGSGTASATNFSVIVTTTAPWNGQIGSARGGVVWQGPVQAFAASATSVGVAES
jgi:hypothetical protein